MKECDAISYLESYQDGKKAGIKEVVDWCKGHRYLEGGDESNFMPYWWVEEDEWQAKLKEWGV